MYRHGKKDGVANEPCEDSQTSQGRSASRDAPPDDPPPDYLSYLVRLWRVGRGEEEHWRASLQRPGTEEPIWFADIEDLFAYLRAETGEIKSG